MPAGRPNSRPRRSPTAPADPRLPVEADDVVIDLADPSDLRDARITDVDGSGDLDDLELIGCTLDGVRLTALSARRVRLTDVVLRNCELSGLDLTGARLRRVRLEGCRAGMVDAGMAAIEDLVVVDSSLTELGLRMASIERARFEGCELASAEMADVGLDAVSFVACDLTGADVTRARMRDVGFRHCTLEGLRGAPSLAGATIDPDQVLPVALALFGALGIALRDPEADPGG